MIAKALLEEVLARAMSSGADFAELYAENTRTNSVYMIDGKVDTATTRRTHGAGIRIFNGLNCIYVYTNDTSASGLMRAAQQAADAVGSVALCACTLSTPLSRS